MENLLLHADNLGRKDQGKTRLTGFHLDLHPGEVVGLLGVNGAGKSTTLALLSGALAPSSGRVQVLGRICTGIPKPSGISACCLKSPLYGSLSVDENLDFAACLRGMKGAELTSARNAVKQRLDLRSLGRRLCSRLSKGMAQRVAIAQALIHGPEILILDEPTAGLDPAQAQSLRDLIRQLGESCGILLASHILADMEQLCQRVIILNEGRQVAEQQLAGSNLVRIQLGSPPQDTTELEQLDGVATVQPQGDGWYQLALNSPVAVLSERLTAHGWQLLALIPARYNLQSLLADAISREAGGQP